MTVMDEQDYKFLDERCIMNVNEQIWTFTRPTASKDHQQCFGLINLNIVRFFDLYITFSRYFGTIELAIT